MASLAIWTGHDGDKEIKTEIHVGDTVRVHYKLIEKEKVSGKTKREVKEETRERIQVFEGIVIAIKGSGANVMFMVRKIGAAAVGIERIFPVDAPFIANIELKKAGKVRRAKLHYLRGRVGKTATNIKQNLETEAPATT